MTSHCRSKICLIKITLSHYTVEILEILRLKYPKYSKGLPLLNEVFVERDGHYNLGRDDFLNYRRMINSVKCGTESVSYLAPKIWDISPKEIKDSETLNTFKAKIKNCVPRGCPCRLSKT